MEVGGIDEARRERNCESNESISDRRANEIKRTVSVEDRRVRLTRKEIERCPQRSESTPAKEICVSERDRR